MSATKQSLIEKIKQLPPQKLAEVEDFVGKGGFGSLNSGTWK